MMFELKMLLTAVVAMFIAKVLMSMGEAFEKEFPKLSKTIEFMAAMLAVAGFLAIPFYSLSLIWR